MNILCTQKLRYHDNIIACLEASMFGIHLVGELVKSNVQFINRCIGDHWDHLGHRGLWPAVGNAVDDPFELFLVGVILLQPIPKVHLCGGLGPANWGMMIKLQWFHAIFTPRLVLAIRCCEENGLRWGPVWNNSKWHLAVRPASHQKFPPLPLFWFQPLKDRKLKCRFGPKHPETSNMNFSHVKSWFSVRDPFTSVQQPNIKTGRLAAGGNWFSHLLVLHAGQQKVSELGRAGLNALGLQIDDWIILMQVQPGKSRLWTAACAVRAKSYRQEKSDTPKTDPHNPPYI